MKERRNEIRVVLPDTISENQKYFYARVTKEELSEAGIHIDNHTPYFYLDAENYKKYLMLKRKREQDLAKKDDNDSYIVKINDDDYDYERRKKR